MPSFKQKLIIIIITAGLALIAIFYKTTPITKPTHQTTQATIQVKEPLILTTNPSPLEEATILPTQIIELTFNYSIVAPSELKHKIDPPADIKIELSADKKTVKVVPIKPYKLGSGYTLFIQPDTKFEGGKILKDEKIFHFKTISYKGI